MSETYRITGLIVSRSKRREDHGYRHRVTVHPNRVGLELSNDGVIAVLGLTSAAIAFSTQAVDEAVTRFDLSYFRNGTWFECSTWEARDEMLHRLWEILERPGMLQPLGTAATQRQAMTDEALVEQTEDTGP